MRVRYDPADGDSTVCEAFGQTFPQGEWVEVEGIAAAKLANNPTFEADGEAPDPEPAALRAQLDGLGIKYHHKAGVEKLKALLPQAEPEPDPQA